MAVASVNLISYLYSPGLRRDADVLAGRLRLAGCRVVETSVDNPIESRIDQVSTAIRRRVRLLFPAMLNLHIELIRLRWLAAARHNWWIPNLEWIREETAGAMHRVDLVLCKTRTAEAELARQGVPVRFIGFTTVDRYRPEVRRALRFLHVGGKSPNKGTGAVLSAWRRHPDWPEIDIVADVAAEVARMLPSNVQLWSYPVDDLTLSRLQNRALFHLCPSEIEGYGHTIAEGLSCGAVVLTTDAPPMNELASADRAILVRRGTGRTVGLATAYEVTSDAVEEAVERALALDVESRFSLQTAARSWFLANDLRFGTEVTELFAGLMSPR